MGHTWRRIAVAFVLIVGIAACGSSTTTSTGSNAAKINNAATADSNVARVHQELTNDLILRRYAGVSDVFHVDGNYLCDIDTIVAGADVATYSGDPDTLVSPNGNVAVKVDEFQGTPISACLQAVDKTLGWH